MLNKLINITKEQGIRDSYNLCHKDSRKVFEYYKKDLKISDYFDVEVEIISCSTLKIKLYNSIKIDVFRHPIRNEVISSTKISYRADEYIKDIINKRVNKDINHPDYISHFKKSYELKSNELYENALNIHRMMER